MSKSVSMLSIALLLLVVLVLWWLFPDRQFTGMDIIITLAVLVMIACFLIEGVKRGREAKQQLPIDDERSKRGEYKAGYYSYLISVYIWVALYFLKGLFGRIEYLLSAGILSMAAVFIIARMIYRKSSKV